MKILHAIANRDFSELKHFQGKVDPEEMAQTRRVGMQNERATLPKAPRFSPYLNGHCGRGSSLRLKPRVESLARGAIRI